MKRSSKSNNFSSMTSNQCKDISTIEPSITSIGSNNVIEETPKRHWILTRTLPEITTRDGRFLDPDDNMFLMNVVREQDRGLVRIVKDIPMDPSVANYRDVNGVVSYFC